MQQVLYWNQSAQQLSSLPHPTPPALAEGVRTQYKNAPFIQKLSAFAKASSKNEEHDQAVP